MRRPALTDFIMAMNASGPSHPVRSSVPASSLQREKIYLTDPDAAAQPADRERMRLLSDFFHDLAAVSDVSLLLNLALDRMLQFSGYEGASIMLLATPDGPLEVCASAGAEAVPVGTVVDDLTHSIAGRTMSIRNALIVEGRGEAIGTDWRSYTRDLAAVICLPLIVGDGPAIGALALKSLTRHHQPAAGDVEALQMLATQLASIIENARLRAERERLINELAGREGELRRVIEQLATVQQDERRRLACDLHDGVAQIAASVHQQLQAFAGRYHPRRPETRRAFEATLDLAQRAVVEMRRLIGGLRPAALDEVGLVAALCHEAAALGIGDAVSCEPAELGPLPAEVETTVFRLVQEALTNVRKHARTTAVRVTLTRATDRLQLEIRDWGCGFDPHQIATPTSGQAGLGIVGMYERVALLGGTLEINSRPGAGTQIRAVLPLPAVDAEATQ